jgi:hypothetical protein
LAVELLSRRASVYRQLAEGAPLDIRKESFMKNVGKLGVTVLGIYLIVIGVLPYLPFLAGLSPLVSLMAIVAGVLILMGR